MIRYSFVNLISVAVDGGWSQFGEWSECSAECGGGVQTRTRACNNPAPQQGGADCVGDATETRACNSDPCGQGQENSNFHSHSYPPRNTIPQYKHITRLV